MEKKWLNKNELKEYVGFSIGKIDNMMKNKEISYSKVGKNVRFDKNEVDNTEMFSFRIPTTMKKRIKLVAKANETNSSEVIRHVLEQSLETILYI